MMRQRCYILDENIIELSARMTNDTNEMDVTCLSLITEMYRRCEHIICTIELLEKYRHHLRILEQGMIRSAEATVKILKLMTSHGKIEVIVEEPPALPNEQGLPSDDIFLVRLAAQRNCILVSTDTRLKQRLEETGIMARHRIIFQHPSEVQLA